MESKPEIRGKEKTFSFPLGQPYMLMNATTSRRNFLQNTSFGLGSVALAGLMGQNAEAARYQSPFAPKRPQHAAKAKRIIFLTMKGGPSHMDLFDYKPRLQADDNKLVSSNGNNRYRGSLWDFAQHGQSGLWFSELLPNLATQADELCMLNGMVSDNPEHAQALDLLHTGSFQYVRPSMGSWVLYGLGSVNQDLPGFVTINPPSDMGGDKYYGNAFLPAAYRGTPIGGDNKPLARVKIDDPNFVLKQRNQQRQKLKGLKGINDRLSAGQEAASKMESVIESFELAFRMQNVLPQVMDISNESEATLKLYGMDQSASRNFGHQCLLARRMAESDVRFIQLTDDGWDHHGGLANGLPRRCASIDQPITGLLVDLRQRGLLEDTLIVWGGEFGRSPDNGNRDGRGHNPTGYTMFMAGAGVKHGFRHGATDEHGRRAVEGQMTVHDLHATMLHLLGLDHEQLTYPWAGNKLRLTGTKGKVVREILA